MEVPAWVPFAHRASVDPVDRTMRELEQQGSGMARLAHMVATLMVVLFSLGSLVALSGDAFTQIVSAIEHHGIPGIPQAISVLVSTLMVVCCDVGLVYAAMTIRVLRVRGASGSEQVLHWLVLSIVSVIESGTYLYMSWLYEHPSGVAWALVVARAVAAPLLSVYLSMASAHPVTPRDILHQAELAQGIQLVRDVLQVAQDPDAALADKMRLYKASAEMSERDRTRLDGMIAVVQDRQARMPAPASVAALPALTVIEGNADLESDDAYAELPPMPRQRYSAARLNDRIEATK
jgi:hypothetical protein